MSVRNLLIVCKNISCTLKVPLSWGSVQGSNLGLGGFGFVECFFESRLEFHRVLRGFHGDAYHESVRAPAPE